MNLEQKLTSMEVAEMVEKNHKDLMRDIRRYCEQLAESKIALGDFFEESTYKDANNQSRPCFLITKKGCEFIAHKMTGTKGTAFTAKYINRFHELEEVVIEKKPMSAMDMIKLQSQALVEIDGKINNLSDDIEKFKQEMPLLGVDMDEVTHAVHVRGVNALGGKDSLAYKDNSLRQQVYSDIYRQLKYQFNVQSYKALARNQKKQALAIIDELPIFLQNAIEAANNQMRLGD